MQLEVEDAFPTCQLVLILTAVIFIAACIDLRFILK